MRHIYRLVLSILAAVTLLTGCGGGSRDSCEYGFDDDYYDYYDCDESLLDFGTVVMTPLLKVVRAKDGPASLEKEGKTTLRNVQRFGRDCSWADSLGSYKSGGRWGYYHAWHGTGVIPPKYIIAYPFSEGNAAVLNEAGWLEFIDREGKVVSVVVQGVGLPAGVSLSPIVDQFVVALKQATNNKYDVVDRQDDFMRFVKQELDYQGSGMVDDRQLMIIGRQFGANLICAILVEWSPVDADYYFRVRMLDTEHADVLYSASYPEEILREKKVKSLERKELQRVSLDLVKKMGLLSPSLPSDWELPIRRKASNGKALGASVVPGLGLMRKGYGGKGCAYLISDIALIGGGLGLLAYANHEKDIMENRGTDYESYNKAVNGYNNAKTASEICFGCAGAVYVVNLIRSYFIDAKPGSRLDYRLDTSYFETPGGSQPGVNFTIAYRF